MSSSKILIIGPAWVGDMVMAQTLFKIIKQQNPAAIIDVLAPAWSADLLARMPEINRAITLPLVHGEFNLKQRWRIGVALRVERYTQAIVLPNSWKSALVPFFAAIPLRTGWARELRYGLLNDLRRLNKTQLPLMIQRFAALAFAKHSVIPAQLPWPALQTDVKASSAALVKFNILQQDPTQRLLILCPGAEFGPAKRWPAVHYAEIAKAHLKQGWSVCIMGSNKDGAVAAEIQGYSENACIDLSGKTSLGEAIDIMARADLVVSNDSGLMHIAAALARPLVVVYGSSSPRFTPPLSARVKIISLNLSCSPCFQRECPLGHFNCLRELAPVTVLKAMQELQTC